MCTLQLWNSCRSSGGSTRCTCLMCIMQLCENHYAKFFECSNHLPTAALHRLLLQEVHRGGDLVDAHALCVFRQLQRSSTPAPLHVHAASYFNVALLVKRLLYMHHVASLSFISLGATVSSALFCCPHHQSAPCAQDVEILCAVCAVLRCYLTASNYSACHVQCILRKPAQLCHTASPLCICFFLSTKCTQDVEILPEVCAALCNFTASDIFYWAAYTP